MRKIVRAFVWISFVLYLLAVFTIVFRMGRGFGNSSSMSVIEYARFHMNLVPFRTIGEYIRAIFDGSMNLSIPIQNLFGNLLLFFPLGIYLPLFFKKLKSWKKYMVTIFIILLGIELVQLFTRRGSFDVDDLILNVSGAMIGCLLWKTRILQWLEKVY